MPVNLCLRCFREVLVNYFEIIKLLSYSLSSTLKRRKCFVTLNFQKYGAKVLCLHYRNTYTSSPNWTEKACVINFFSRCNIVPSVDKAH